MRVVLQRVKRAQVTVNEAVIGKIGTGVVLLVGFTDGDGPAEIEYCTRKITRARIFADSNGKMNQNIQAVGGAILVVSQFTLYANTRRGNRPSFTAAEEAGKAQSHYEQFIACLRETGVPVATGQFGADMRVELVNDGPVTIIYDTNDK
ncbi:D-aminoacyl-tRNA deacylase [Ligilactobacillus sp. LYQ60]|uniref:D-aminoacyl-tRNA deacylase n=1 Tax=unclassified Ligilactobacillus TaxID=2767920 RepID=UPI0038531044